MTVTVAWPVAAVPEAVNVSVLLVPVTDTGLNAAVTPAGSPPASERRAGESPERATAIVLVPPAP